MKQCSVCGQEKPLSEFYSDKRKRDGHAGHCKQCHLETCKRWYAEKTEDKVRAAPEEREQRRREKKREKDRRYREKNREAIAERKREYQQANKDKVRASGLRWRAANAERKAQTDREWALAHQDNVRANRKRWRSNPENKAKVSVNSKAWRAENIDRAKAQSRAWIINNHDAAIAKTHRRRARQRQAEGSYTAREWQDLCAQYGNRCLCCGRDDVPMTVDHVIPLSKGGSNSIDNIQPLCRSCNDKKSTKAIDYRYTAMELRCPTIRMQPQT